MERTSLLGLTLRPLLHQHSLLYLVAFEAVAMEDLVGYSSSSEDEQENQCFLDLGGDFSDSSTDEENSRPRKKAKSSALPPDQCKESELSVSNDGRKEASALPSVEDAFTQFNPPSFLNDAKAKSKAKSVPIDDGVENSSGLAKDSCSESAPTQLGSTRQRPRIDLGKDPDVSGLLSGASCIVESGARPIYNSHIPCPPLPKSQPKKKVQQQREKQKVKKRGQSEWRSQSSKGYWKSDMEMKMRDHFD